MAVATEYWKLTKADHQSWLTRAGIVALIAEVCGEQSDFGEFDFERMDAKKLGVVLCGLTDAKVEFFGGAK